jgi:3-oxoacyl-[acyl-carrier-protein] synthase II
MGQLRGFSEGFGEGAGLLVLEKAGHARSRGAALLARVDGIRTVGRLAPGAEDEGIARLLPHHCRPELIALSGTAHLEQRLLSRLPKVATLDTGKVLGRSLAMGGISLTALVLNLERGEQGLQLAASPEGPYFAIDLVGGDAV